MTKNKPEYKEFEIAEDPYLDDPEIYSPEVQERLERLKKFFAETGSFYTPEDLSNYHNKWWRG